MKTALVALAALLAIVLIASFGHYEGELHAVDPLLAATIHDSATWYARPHLVADNGDPQAVYVVAPEAPRGDRFAAVRVKASTGAQSAASVTLAPKSPFRPFRPATHVQVEVHGLHFARPALHLLTFPDGRGPGVHPVDSATGRIVLLDQENGVARPLVTRNAFNSSSAAELLSLVSADPSGRWIALLSRTSSGWTLYLFARASS